MTRLTISLDGVWRFQPDPYGWGEREGFFGPGHDVSQWRQVRVPCCFEACGPGMDAYEGLGWFRRSVRVPADWEGKRVVLHFEGIAYHATAWLNGERVGRNEDGFLPFGFEVTTTVEYGRDNVIVVASDNRRVAGEVPGEKRGWRSFGGFQREAALAATDPLHMADLAVNGAPDGTQGRVDVEAEVVNRRAVEVVADVEAQFLAPSGAVLASVARTIELAPGGSATIAEHLDVDEPRLWSPATPDLYSVRMALRYEGRVVDELTRRTGFRSIEARDGRLLLNGEPLYITGWNRHEDSAVADMAVDHETTERDLREMKDAGANFVRLCHYPHHPRELDLCDELGLLAMCEVPLYWWDGAEEGEETCAATYAAAERQLGRLIARDRSHPSVVFWSVSNETHEERPEVAESNRKLVRLARKLDPTRLCVHVSHRWWDHANFSEDDVICINAYPSQRGLAREGSAYDFGVSGEMWARGIAHLREQYPGTPILVTEFGHPSLEGTNGHAFGEDVAAHVIEHEFAGMQAQGVCGAVIWCWADHAWPAETFRFVNGLAISPFGVVSRERTKKAAYWVARRLFRERQGLPGD